MINPLDRLKEKLLETQDSRTRVDLLNETAWEMRDTDFSEAARLCEEAAALSQDETVISPIYTLGVAASLRTLSYIENVQGDFSGAIKNGGQALALLEETPDLKIKNQVLRTMGYACVQIGEFDQAFSYLFQGLAIARQIKDRADEARFLDLLGLTYSQYGNNDEAVGAYNQALETYREQGDRRGEAISLNNLAVSLTYIQRLDEALKSAQESLEIALSLGLKPLQTAIYGTLGEAYYYQGDMENASLSFQSALASAMETGSKYAALYNYLLLGKVAISQGNYETAEAHLLKSLEMCTETGVLKEQYECHELLANLYETLGKYELALRHFKSYYLLNSEIWKNQAETRIANVRLTMELESAKKDAEINQLRTEALQREIEERKQFQNQLEELVARDSLTDLFNRRHFFAIAEKVLQQQVASGVPMALIMFDIDHFKNVNDTYGHQVGDGALRKLAATVRGHVRKDDLVCRYGGEEFVVLLPSTDLGQAHQLAERLRQAIETMEVVHEENLIRVTISLGVIATTPTQEYTLDDLLRLADHALYTAKALGRNRIAAWTPS